MDPEDPCWVRILLLFLIGRGRDESGPCAEEQSFLVDDSNRRQKNLKDKMRGCTFLAIESLTLYQIKPDNRKIKSLLYNTPP